MKKIRKIVSLLLCCIMVISMGTVSASAFGGYTHWTMAALIAALDTNRSDQAKLAYMSGCLLADIGKSTWDGDTSIDSDSYTFTKKMYDLSKSIEDLSASAKIMAYGWRDHYIQDKKGDTDNTTSPYAEMSNQRLRYKFNCAWIDEYFRDEIQLVDSPIQDGELDGIYVSYKLINRTYQALANFSPTVEDIQNEILDMFALYDLAILGNAQGWEEDEAESIINEMDRVIALCPGIVDVAPVQYDTRSVANSVSETLSIENYVTESDIEELTAYMVLEETPISDSEAYISISVTNKKAYADKLNTIVTDYETDLLSQEVLK